MPEQAVCKQKVRLPNSEMLRWCGNAAEETSIGPRCPQHSPPPSGGHPNGYRIRAIMAADKLGLTREERHDLAEVLVKHTGSWSTLSEADARRVGDGLESFLIIQALLFLRTGTPTG